METPQTTALRRRSKYSQQRTLVIIVVTLGLLLGGLAGAAVAADAELSPDAGVAEETAQPVGTQEPAGGIVPTDSVTMSQSEPWREPVEESPGELAIMPLIFKVCFGLGLVVMLAWGTVYLLRRTTLGQGMASADSTVRVVDRNWLGPKKAIYLVDISGRTLALGVTEEHISVLSTWEAGEIDLQRPQPTGSFANQFRGILQRRRESTDMTGADVAGAAR